MKKKIADQNVSDDAIHEGLAAIYGNERDDLHIVEQAPNRVTRFLVRLIFALLVVCTGVGIGYGAYQYWFAGDRDGKPLLMTFTIPEDVQSGSDVELVLTYHNQTAYPLTALSIDINVPSGFVPKRAEPAMNDGERLTWDLGTLGARSDGKILLEGTWFADVPSTTGVQALAEYKPANFNANFHDIATATVHTTTSTTAVRIDGPGTVNAGESFSYTVTIEAVGSEAIIAPNVVMTLPEGFFIATSTPSLPAGGALVWTLGDVLPGAPQTILVTGAFASDDVGDALLTVVSGIAGTRFSPQATGTVMTTVKPSALAVTMVGNGATGAIAADPGSTLRLGIRVENTSSAAITDATAFIDFIAEDNLPIVWNASSLDGGKITAKGITYDAKTIGDIPPGGHTTLDLILPLKTDLSAGSSAFSVASSVTYGGMTISAAPLSVVVNSDAFVTSSLRYFDEDGSPLGSGSLPPSVGKTTHYRAVWTVHAGTHDLRDVTVSATLPDGVVWDDFVTANTGFMTYNDATRVVTWTIANIPASSDDVSARMSVAVTPKEEDRGTEKIVIGTVIMRAKDDATGSSIERTDDAVTTMCNGDDGVAGKGIVL